MTPERIRRRAAVGIIGATTTVCVALAAAQWPRYWTWIASEQTPMTFVQASLLLLAGAFCALLAAGSMLDSEPDPARRWGMLALGLTVLAADERFAIHERLRDGYLAGLGVGLPWGAPGDYLLAVAFVAALVAMPWVWQVLRHDRLVRSLFLTGLGLYAAAVLADSFDPGRLTVAAERLQQSVEEVVEALAAACLAAATCAGVVARLARPVASAAAPAPSGAAKAEPVASRT